MSNIIDAIASQHGGTPIVITEAAPLHSWCDADHAYQFADAASLVAFMRAAYDATR
jgi:hypothetical protein